MAKIPRTGKTAQSNYIPDKYGSSTGSSNCPECGHDMVIEAAERQLVVTCVNCPFTCRTDQQPGDNTTQVHLTKIRRRK